jgi:hypothetical protein
MISLAISTAVLQFLASPPLGATYRTVFLMEFLNMKNVQSRLDSIVVEFIPPGKRGQSWAGNMGQGMEIKTPDRSNGCP